MAGRFKYDGLRMPIMTTPIHKDDDLGNDLDKSQWSFSVYLVVTLFSVSATLGLNALWVTFPTSTSHLPEGTALSSYLIGFTLFGNFGALAYLIGQKCVLYRKCPEVLLIYGSLLVALVASALIAVFWEDPGRFLGYQNHGVIFLGCSLFLAQAGCLAMVTYIPFVSRLKPAYITAVLMGEAMAGLITHLVAIGQGIGEPPECRQEQPMNRSWILLTGWRARLRPTTTLAPIMPPPLRFDESIYFFVMAGVLCIAGFSFLVLRCIPSVRFEYDQVPVDSMDEVLELPHLARGSQGYAEPPSGDRIRMSTIDPSPNCSTHVLDDGTLQQTRHTSNSTTHQGLKKHPWRASITTLQAQAQRGHPEGACISSGNNHRRTFPKLRPPSRALSPYQPPPMCLMLTFTFWACLVTEGPLSSTKAHACIPLGNRVFQSGTLMTKMASILAVVVATRVNPYSRVALVVAFTSLGTIVLTYFVALISFSHESESKEDSPIFMNTGELLSTIAWAAVYGLFYFTRTMVAVLLRQHDREMLAWYAAVSLLGVSLGSLFMVNNISICRIYRDFETLYCTSHS